MTVRETVKKFDAYKYYGIIGLLSVIVVFFMPFISSEIGMELNLPDTAAGWVIYLITKALVVAINLAIFYSFMEQAKLNVRDNPKYLEANEILDRYFKEVRPIPMSPEEWTRKQYRGKGISLGITTLLSAVALTNAVLSFDAVTMITYLFTIVMGVIFGVIQMGTAEDYWTGQYWEYAIYIRDQKEPKEAMAEVQEHEVLSTNNKQTDNNVPINCVPNILESCNSRNSTCSNNLPTVLGTSASMDSILDRTLNSSNTNPACAGVTIKETL
jgi:hypothetical protein